MGFSPFGYTLIPTELLLVFVKTWMLLLQGDFQGIWALMVPIVVLR
jgi:hypothetical protein